METAINSVVPIFGLILAGYVMGRTALIGRAGSEGLTNFVFYAAVPALLFRTAAERIDLAVLQPDIVLAYYGGTLVAYAIGAVAARLLFAARMSEQAVVGMSTAYGNTVLMGIPLILALYGPSGLASMMLIVALQTVILMPLTTVFVELGRPGKRGAGVAAAIVTAVVKNPIVLSLAAGVAAGAVGVPIPGPATRFIDLLSAAAAPCALFALGASLTTFRVRGALGEAFVVTVLKLAVHPAVVWLLATFAFGLAPRLAAIATITAALPVGATTFIVARRSNVRLEGTASAIMVSTALSIVTLSAVIAVLGPQQ